MVELGFALPFWFLSIAYVYVLVWGGNYGGPLPRRASFAYDFIICSSSGSKKAIFSACSLSAWGDFCCYAFSPLGLCRIITCSFSSSSDCVVVSSLGVFCLVVLITLVL